jgi:adhesin transport system outer membrane protein
MKIRKTLCIMLALAFPAATMAQNVGQAPHATLKDIAQKAILTNPEVQSKWHNFKAAEDEIDFARGGFLPKVDLIAGTGKQKLKQPPATTSTSFSRSTYAISLNQMLFDGFATSSEVKRLGRAKLVRYYELLDASEATALEAGKAYLDVLRYRLLLDIAEDNYVQHRATYEQLLRRTQSGVGRRVDLEQAASRLALAEVNLTTEEANLHDVTARFQRIVNEQPPKVVFPQGSLNRDFPGSQQEAVARLLKNNPALLASHENVEASIIEIEGKRSAFYPRVDLRARQDSTSNYTGLGSERTDNVAEVFLTYNLFNGGSDLARSKQYVEKKNVAIDLREKSCRDTRQTLLIAYNDVNRLTEQLASLNSQVELLEKTRDAYRDQFNVGQRTLLDLLDTENELLSARRSAVNADLDLSLAYLRTQAGMGTFLNFLGLKKLEVNEPGSDEFSKADLSQLCPIEGVKLESLDRANLNAKALALLQPAKPVAMAPAAPVRSGPEATISNLMDSWAAAWTRKDYKAYTEFYASSFTPDGGLARDDWAQLRRSRILTRETINVTVSDINVKMDGNERATAEFTQRYQSNVFNDQVKKTLELIKVDGKWLINRETSIPCEGNTVGGCKVSKLPAKPAAVKGSQ